MNTINVSDVPPPQFGLPPATVVETTCQARGDEVCMYEVTWDAGLAAQTADPAEHITMLESQLSAMTERLDSVYAPLLLDVRIAWLQR